MTSCFQYVSIDDRKIPLSFKVSNQYVYCEASNCETYSRISDSSRKSGFKSAHELALTLAKQEYDEMFNLNKDKRNIPTLSLGSQKLPLSITHHGRFEACSIPVKL